MVPKLHAKGSSFKGAAAYLLHDKDRADTSERVAWTDVRNLAVDDPHVAWKVMVATAMDQQRLKERSGIANTGRKSDKHVLHFTLSWHPDQSPTREDMIEAADEALKALGAGGHQAMIVSHNDEDHPHVHLLVNRVSPEDGRLLSSSKEKLKLSEWAQAYEGRTQVYCENRIINNELRSRGEYVRGTKDQARHLFEEQRAASVNDNSRAKAVLDKQRAKDHALALRGRNMEALHEADRDRLETAHKQRRQSIDAKLKQALEQVRREVRGEFQPMWRALNARQRKEREVFENLEASLFGKASNMVRTARVSVRDVVAGRSKVISRTFGILTNAGERRTYFEAAQERERITLKKRQASETETRGLPHRETQKKKIADSRSTYLRERESLQKRQEADRTKHQADWKKRSQERTEAMTALARSGVERAKLLKDHKQATGGSDAGRSFDDAVKRQSGKSAFDRARQDPAREQDNDRDQDRNEDDDWER